MLSFKPTFSLSSFTFIKRLFSSSSLSAIRVVPSAYLRLLIFLPAILIPACASSSLECKSRSQGTPGVTGKFGLGIQNEAEAAIKIAGRNINNLRYADDSTLMEENEELKSLLMRVKEDSEKAGLKLNI